MIDEQPRIETLMTQNSVDSQTDLIKKKCELPATLQQDSDEILARHQQEFADKSGAQMILKVKMYRGGQLIESVDDSAKR